MQTLNKYMTSNYKLAAAMFVAILAVSASAAFLTPGSGVSATAPVRASFVDSTDIRIKVKGDRQEVLHVPNARETVMHQITVQPAINNGGQVGNTGWHSHPGPVVVLIESGEMSFYSSDDPTCTARTYTAGQAFVDSGQGHAHTARNEGTVPLVLSATYFDVPPGGAFRIDAPNPGNCSF